MRYLEQNNIFNIEIKCINFFMNKWRLYEYASSLSDNPKSFVAEAEQTFHYLKTLLLSERLAYSKRQK